MGFAFGAFVGLGRDGMGSEAGSAEASNESGFFASGPKSDRSVWAKASAEKSEALAIIESGIFGLDERGWAIIDIEENGIVGGGWGSADEFEDIADEDFDAWVIEEFAVDGAEKLAIPVDDFGEEFGDMDGGVWVEEGEDALEAVAEAEATDEDGGLGLVGKASAG